MATPVFSGLLYLGQNVATGGVTIGPPPSGYRWVALSIKTYNVSAPGTPLQGWYLGDSTAYAWIGRQWPEVWSSTPYNWSGHQALDNPNVWRLTVLEGNWTVRISGWVLTLP